MHIVLFTHPLVSCWNHGNAHFLRGVVRALLALGHRVSVWEPQQGWSRQNLIADAGAAALTRFATAIPDLAACIHTYPDDQPAPAIAARACDGADLVLVHEWTDRDLVAAIGRLRAGGAQFRLLFHDTHHRAVSAPEAIRAFELSAYDGVLAFGARLAQVWAGWGWGERAFVWHAAADTSLFHPPACPPPPGAGLVWVGNWGDGERTAELSRFLFRPAAAAPLALTVHGVRYPPQALAALAAAGVQYGGFLPNAQAPAVYARHLATIHVPRRPCALALRGIPTIRVSEALAAGIALISAPWCDDESLFRVGTDFLMVRDEAEMLRALQAVARDPDARRALVQAGWETVSSRHTCAHRAAELMLIHDRLAA